MATAEQTVSAVLEATNKAYIVETGDSEDGLSHYRRWSDGTIEQWGVTGSMGQSLIQLSFPIEFTDTTYSFTTFVNEGTSSGNWFGVSTSQKTTSGIRFEISGNPNNANNYSWYAIGK